MRNVGQMGEAELEQWAAQTGIVANKVKVDKKGWDFIILEFPSEAGEREDAPLPLDKSLLPWLCKVQVKSSDRRPGREQIKLSNLKQLVQDLVPAFYLILEFDGKESPQRAYLVHVGPKLIRRVMKKLRELGPEYKEQLHKKR